MYTCPLCVFFLRSFQVSEIETNLVETRKWNGGVGCGVGGIGGALQLSALHFPAFLKSIIIIIITLNLEVSTQCSTYLFLYFLVVGWISSSILRRIYKWLFTWTTRISKYFVMLTMGKVGEVVRRRLFCGGQPCLQMTESDPDDQKSLNSLPSNCPCFYSDFHVNNPKYFIFYFLIISI